MCIKNFTLVFSLLFSLFSLAQTNDTISTSGMSFSPSELTIEIGDTVTFINTGGSHNVNGTQATFPNNPESFGNSVGTGWTYQHIFSIVGEYDFQCNPHASHGMTGKVIVQSNTSTQNLDFESHSNIFPNPFQNELAIQGCNGGEVFLYSVVGRLELNQQITNDSYTLSTNELPSGIYLYQITMANKETVSGKIIKK
jgi:plastocyanin